MKMQDIPMEKRVRNLINEIAREMSPDHECDVCGPEEGVGIYEDADEEMLALMSENSAIGTCRCCGAVVKYSIPELFTFGAKSEDDIAPIEYRVLSPRLKDLA